MPSHATFRSIATGSVFVTQIAGDSIAPAQSRRLYVTLESRGDSIKFESLIESGTILPSASIEDPRDGMRYSLRGVVVTGKRADDTATYHSGSVTITLAFQAIRVTNAIAAPR